MSAEEISTEGPILLTIEDVMRELRVSKRWCYATKLLPWIRVGGHKRLRRTDLEKFLDNRTVKYVMRHSLQVPVSNNDEPMD